MKPPTKPMWKQVFDTVEKAAAPVMAEATSSAGFAEIMKVGLKINAEMQEHAEALSRQWLHAWNLPAAGDVSYLKGQIGSLEAEVRSLRRVIESQTATDAVPAKQSATKRAAKKPAAKRAPARKTTVKKTTAKKAPAKKMAVPS